MFLELLKLLMGGQTSVYSKLIARLYQVRSYGEIYQVALITILYQVSEPFQLAWEEISRKSANWWSSKSNIREKWKTHRLSSTLSTSIEKLERSSSRNRTWRLASIDVRRRWWRQSMVTLSPFVMTYRPWDVLLIDLGTLLSLKLLICGAENIKKKFSNSLFTADIDTLDDFRFHASLRIIKTESVYCDCQTF